MKKQLIIQFLLLTLIFLTSCQRGSGSLPNPHIIAPSPTPSLQPHSAYSLDADESENENQQLQVQWTHPRTGLRWGPVIIQGSLYLRVSQMGTSGSSVLETGWLFFEAEQYCQFHQARLPSTDEWTQLLEASGAQFHSDDPFEAPSSFNLPQFLSRDDSSEDDLSSVDHRLNFLHLATPALEHDANMTIFHHIANRQTGAFGVAGHRELIPFVCVW